MLPEIDVHWLTTSDGQTFDRWVAGAPVVHTGGGSETDLAFTEDGGIVAVMRNEAGDEDGWGSKVCRAPPISRGGPAPRPEVRLPLVFSHKGRVWLIGRRNLNDDGAYDLFQQDLSHADQTLSYQAAY